MRTAEEILAEAIAANPYGRRNLAILAAIRQAQVEAIEAASHCAVSFLVGDPENGVPLHSPSPHQIANRIRTLLSKDKSTNENPAGA